MRLLWPPGVGCMGMSICRLYFGGRPPLTGVELDVPGGRAGHSLGPGGRLEVPGGQVGLSWGVRVRSSWAVGLDVLGDQPSINSGLSVRALQFAYSETFSVPPPCISIKIVKRCDVRRALVLCDFLFDFANFGSERHPETMFHPSAP